MNQPVQVTPELQKHMTVKTMRVGADKQSFTINQDGVFAGGDRFDNATWRVYYTGKQEFGSDGAIVIDPDTKTITVGLAPDQIILDAINKKITVGGTEIVLDAVAKKITVGANGEVVLDGTLGQIVTNNIKDKTYGFYGTFAAQFKSTNFTISEDIIIAPIQGGLMNVVASIVDEDVDNIAINVPNLHTTGDPFWYIFKDAGSYKIKHRGDNIGTIYIGWTYVMYTVFFNSNEAAASY